MPEYGAPPRLPGPTLPGPGLRALISIPGAGLLARMGCGLAARGIPIPGPGLLDRLPPFVVARFCGRLPLPPALEPPYALPVPQFSVLDLISLLVNAGCGTPNAGAPPPLEPS